MGCFGGLGPSGWGRGAQPGSTPAACPPQGPAWEQCGLYPPGSRAARSAGAARPDQPPQHGAGAARPGHGEGWRWAEAGQAGSRRPPRPAAEWPDASASSSRSPWAAPTPRLVVGLGVWPARLCHVCHPVGTQEHLSKIPGGRGRAAAAASGPPSPSSQCQMRAGDKSSIFLVLPGWQPGRPQRHLAPGSPASGCRGGPGPGPAGQDRGTDRQRWPETRMPRALSGGSGTWGRPAGRRGLHAAASRRDRRAGGSRFHSLAGEEVPHRPPAPWVSHLLPSLLLEPSRGLCHLVLRACYVAAL